MPYWASQVVLVVKNLPASATDERDTGQIPGSGRSPGEGHDNPLQNSCLGNPNDREAWQAIVRRIAKSQIQLKQLSLHAHTQMPPLRYEERSNGIQRRKEVIWPGKRRKRDARSLHLKGNSSRACITGILIFFFYLEYNTCLDLYSA